MPLYNDKGERTTVVVASAGVALHALLGNQEIVNSMNLPALVDRAFNIAEAFVAEAEKRFP